MIHEDDYQEFVDKVQVYIDELFTGKFATECKSYGRAVNVQHWNHIMNLLENHGGELVCGGKGDEKTLKVEPTIIKNPSPDSNLAKNEVFGPILSVNTFKDFSEVMDNLHDSEKPLAMYYFGAVNNNQNKDDIEHFTSSGMLTYNEVILQGFNPHFPFGGVGYSGNGCFKSIEGFKTFSHQKPVLVKPTFNFGPFRRVGMHPYSEESYAELMKLASIKKDQGFLIFWGKMMVFILFSLIIAYKFVL
jgi:aldehyde dehydrogenase (NAD+)